MDVFTFKSSNRFRIKSMLLVAAFVVATISFDQIGRSDPPFPSLFKRTGNTNAGPINRELKTDHGPWLIFAMSFDGENSKENATALAEEIQKSLGFQAYVMPKKFDFSELLYGSGLNDKGQQKVMKYRDARVVEGSAVLIGDFDSSDSPAIQSALTSIKNFMPRSMNTQSKSNKDEVSIKDWKSQLRHKYGDKGQEKAKGPMSLAFITRNPLLPQDFFRAPEVERFVYDLNRDPGYNEFNLMDCKSKFTVRVATFLGEDRVVSWSRPNATKAKSGPEELTALEQAAQSAYLVTKALRAGGIEAYQFHDRVQSIVTVGGFEELGAVDANNQFQYTKQILDTMRRFGPHLQPRQLSIGTAAQPTSLFDVVDQRKIPELYEGTRQDQLDLFRKLAIGFDLKPTPMTVPRYHASRIYAGSLLGGRK